MIEVEQIKALIDEEDGLDDDDHVDKVERSLEFRSLLLVVRQSAHRGISGSHLELQEIGLYYERLDENSNYLKASASDGNLTMATNSFSFRLTSWSSISISFFLSTTLILASCLCPAYIWIF